MEQKIFKSKNLKIAELRSRISRYAKSIGVYKVAFNKQSKIVDGTYNAARKIMFLNAKLSKKRLLRAFFHELGHHKACMQNLWLDYHFGLKTLNPETDFLIENNIDIIAQSLWNKYVCTKAWGKYKYYYPRSQKNKLTKWLKLYNNQ